MYCILNVLLNSDYYYFQGAKAESAPKTDVIPVEFHDVRHTKAAFKKLMRACVPSSPNVEPEQSFYKSVQKLNQSIIKQIKFYRCIT